jgi:uncharacterized protein involved in exopolysaccharide biosynthesis
MMAPRLTKQESEIDLEVRGEPLLAAEAAAEVDTAVARAWLFKQLRLLWEQRHWLSRAAVAGAVLGLFLAFALPKRYQASTQLMPPDNQSTSAMGLLAGLSGAADRALGSAAGDLLGQKSSGALFIGILRSRTVEGSLVDHFQLTKAYGTRLKEDAQEELQDNTAISEDRKNGIITIAVTDRNPQRAAAMAGEYVEELNRVVTELNTSSAHRERVFLEGRLAEVKQDLESAEKGFSEFASKNTAIDIQAQGKAMIESAATLEGQWVAAQTELQGLKQIYAGDNVRVRTIQARVDELDRQLQKLGGKFDTANEPDRIETPSPNDPSIYPSIRKLPLLGVTYADLYRSTKVQEATFETLTEEYELAKVQEAKETPSVKVLDAATVPEKRSFPHRLPILVFCVCLALAGAAAFILGRAHWAEVAADDAGKILAGEVFEAMHASMPWAEPNGSRVQAMMHRVWAQAVRRNGSRRSGEDAPYQL